MGSSNLQFKALKVPEPVDTKTSAINTQETEAVSDSQTSNVFFF